MSSKLIKSSPCFCAAKVAIWDARGIVGALFVQWLLQAQFMMLLATMMFVVFFSYDFCQAKFSGLGFLIYGKRL
jgi:hypothetical protein